LPTFVLDKMETVFHLKTKSAFIKKQNSFVKKVCNSVCVIAIVFSLSINFSSLDWIKYELKNELQIPVDIFRWNQYWGMFSPNVIKKDGWFVYYGIDEQGRQWDLQTNSDYVDFKKPEHIVKRYKTDRWRKLAENMANNNFTFLRPLFGKYILDEWNGQHPEKKIVTLNLYYMEKISLPDYKTTEPVKNLYCVSQ